MGLSLAETKNGDTIEELDDLHFILDEGLIRLMRMMGGITIDYRENRWFGGSFHVRFQNSASSCC